MQCIFNGIDLTKADAVGQWLQSVGSSSGGALVGDKVARPRHAASDNHRLSCFRTIICSFIKGLIPYLELDVPYSPGRALTINRHLRSIEL